MTFAVGDQVTFDSKYSNPTYMTYTITPQYIDHRPKKGTTLFTTAYVKTVGGYVGQIRHEDTVVWESSRVRTEALKASADAEKYLNNKIKELFA